MLEFRSGGRRVSSSDFMKNLQRQMIDKGMEALEARARGAAASIVDPATGKHAEVMVYRSGDTELKLRTRGSPAFARELERRLGLTFGQVQSTEAPIAAGAPRIYLAHASEDKAALATPLAEFLLEQGIDVWLDQWEIQAGDSLRQRMDDGLGECTHFVVLLTPRSRGKPWVEREIDAGFVRSVNGRCRFIPLRIGVEISDLSPFLQSVLCPTLALDDAAAMSRLVDDFQGRNGKPALGSPPRHIQTLPDGLAAWSPLAVTVACLLLDQGEHGAAPHPQLEFHEIASITGLSPEDVRLGVLDLSEAGLVNVQRWDRDAGAVWPKAGLFVEFNQPIYGLDTRGDAVLVAGSMIDRGADGADVTEIAATFPEWSTRRLNGALSYLDAANLVKSLTGADAHPYALVCLYVTDQTRRFVRNAR